MSTQSEREAAARRFDASARRTEDENTFGAVINVQGSGWFLPNGMDSNRVGGLAWDDIVGSWVVHVRALDAKPAPVDALEGVAWRTPAEVMKWASHAGAVAYRDFGVAQADRDVVARVVGLGWTDDMYEAIIAHARAQLARDAYEAARKAALDECKRNTDAATGAALGVAPAKPAALTLEQARAMLEAAGATVTMPKVGGFERPDLALARAEAEDMFVRCCDQMSHADKVEYDGEARGILIARLRALGVTPAVLS